MGQPALHAGAVPAAAASLAYLLASATAVEPHGYLDCGRPE